MNHIKNLPNQPILAMEFRDPNQISKVSPWELDFRQIEPSLMKTWVRVRQGSYLSAMELGVNRAVHQTGIAPAGTVTMGISLSAGVARWGASSDPTNRLLGFGGQDGFDGLTDAAFHGITFSARTDAMEMLVDTLKLPISDISQSCGAISDEGSVPRLTRVARRARRWLLPENNLLLTLNDEEEILESLLLASCAEPRQSVGSALSNRERALSNALDFMDTYAEENPTISQLCKISGLTYRTLHRAFNDAFGIGPKAYQLRLRLGRAKLDIIAAEKNVPIVDIANKWGFWHMGQFAKDFRRQFGELPSEASRIG